MAVTAANKPACASARCNKCNHSSLSLLLLRPSPIPYDKAVSPITIPPTMGVDAGNYVSILPKWPSKSRFVLRLLRKGYVHVYVPAAALVEAHWMVFRVTDQADLLPEHSELFSTKVPDATCELDGHNLTGQKLLNIPQAHKIPKIWIAFSANLWDEKFRATVAAGLDAAGAAAKPALTAARKSSAPPPKNGEALPFMQLIQLAGGSPCTFSPTVDALKASVLECNFMNKEFTPDTVHDFPFNSVSHHVHALRISLVDAAKRHDMTRGRELAVVLADPVAIASELNATRLRRGEILKLACKKPEIEHPLNSLNAIEQIKKNLLDASHNLSLDGVSRLGIKDSMLRPQGGTWFPLQPEFRAKKIEEYKNSTSYATMIGHITRGEYGRYLYRDQAERQAAWAFKDAEERWAKLAPYFDSAKAAEWLKKHEEKMEREHYTDLKKYESDWRAVAEDTKVFDYFANHFDENDPNDCKQHHSPGTSYCAENYLINQPAPISMGDLTEKYAKMFFANILDPRAIALRATVGNQFEWIDVFHKIINAPNAGMGLTGELGDQSSMRDKSYDILKEVTNSKLLKNHKWMGDATASFSLGMYTAATGAVLSVASRTGLTEKAATQLIRIKYVGVAVEYIKGHVSAATVRGATRGLAPKLPIVITMFLSPADALELQARRVYNHHNVGMGTPALQAELDAKGKVRVTLLTDTDTLLAHGNDALAAAKSNVGKVKMGDAATEMLEKTAKNLKVGIITRAQFAAILSSQTSRLTKIIGGLRTAEVSNAGKVAKSLFNDMETRVAIGGMTVQVIGLIFAISGLNGIKDDDPERVDKRRAAWLGIMDSNAGIFGSLFQVMAAAQETRITLKVSEEAAKKALSVAGLKILSGLAGVAGGVINWALMMREARTAESHGDHVVSYLYTASAAAFLGTAGTAALAMAGVAAESMTARVIGGSVARSIAGRLGAGGALAAVGITVSGVGLFLLVAGVTLQIGAIALTPNPVQKWMRRSYFGQDKLYFFGHFGGGQPDDSFKEGWQEEFEELLKAFGTSFEEVQKEDAERKAVAAAKKA